MCLFFRHFLEHYLPIAHRTIYQTVRIWQLNVVVMQKFCLKFWKIYSISRSIDIKSVSFLLRCPPLTVLRQNMTVYLNVNANVNLGKFLAKYYSNHTSGNLTMTRDVIYTLGGHVRFEDSSKAPPLSMDLIPDHVYSSTTFVARRTADAHVLATVIVVSALALVFVRYRLVVLRLQLHILLLAKDLF